jgi:5-methylcytosine-specific restriction protein B
MSYPWIPVYREIANKIITYRDRQDEILSFLKELKERNLPVVSLDDKDANNQTIPLEVIDPFTFFACFNRGQTLANRKEIIGSIIQWLGLSCSTPDDFSGVPTANNQSSWFFSWSTDRRADDINWLWDMAKEVLAKKPHEVDGTIFDNCLTIKRVGFSYLTVGCFWLNPIEFISLDGNIRNYIFEKYNIKISQKTYAEYRKVINNIREKTTDDFFKMSFDAWESSQNAIGYWAGGHEWDGVSKAQEFIDNNYWQIGWSRNDTEKAAQQAFKLYDKIKVGDEFAIKGLGGKYKLKVYYIGKVVDKEPETGKLELEQIPDRILYSGQAPKGSGVGNWFGTLVAVTKPEIIKSIFHGSSVKIVEPPMPPVIKGSPEYPVNLILYGPPGTGKTYRIQNEYKGDFVSEETIDKDSYLIGITEKMRWWEVVAVALLELGKAKLKDIYNHELIKAKANTTIGKTPNHTVRFELQNHTVPECKFVNCSRKTEPLIFSKDADSQWTLVKDIVQKETPELLDIASAINGYSPTPQMTKRCELVTFHQSYSYEEFIEGIRPQLDEAESVGGEIRYEIKRGLFRCIAQRAYDDPEHQYALFIDEINRGNISKIFGELITLVELDKRINKSDQDKGLKVRLPYSQDEFGVPDNLSIIGTMNTADRSIAFIDTALRRRFQFKEILPDINVIKTNIGEINGIDVAALLGCINRRIEFLFDRDHMIGHSYFLEVDSLLKLREVFLMNVIPLLQEYFHRDWDKMCLVLGCPTTDDEKSPQPNLKPIIKATVMSSQEVFGIECDEYMDKRQYSVNDDFIIDLCKSNAMIKAKKAAA